MERILSKDFSRRYGELHHTISRAEEKKLNEDEILYHEVLVLFNEIVVSNSEHLLAVDCGRLLNRFYNKQVRTIYGGESQYTDGSSSSCTSCAQALLLNALPLRLACGLQNEQKTSFVQMGKELSFALLKQAEAIKEENSENSGESFILQQVFSSHKISMEDGLKFIDFHPERVFKKNADELTDGFFLGQFFEKKDLWSKHLSRLEGMFTSERTKIGAIIDYQEKTYALIILITQFGMNYIFFDPHGNPEFNEGNPNAYVKCTFDQNAMAQILAVAMQGADQLTTSRSEKMLSGNYSYMIYRMEVS